MTMKTSKRGRGKNCRFITKLKKIREKEGERPIIACTVPMRYRFRCELGAIWQCFEDDFISVCRRPSGMLHVRTYVVHDASPFHVAAVPLAGNCRGDRLPLCIGRPRDALSGWHRRLRPEYFVRVQGGIGLSPITRGHVREGRENNVHDDSRIVTERDSIRVEIFASIFNFNFLTFVDSRGFNRLI